LGSFAEGSGGKSTKRSCTLPGGIGRRGKGGTRGRDLLKARGFRGIGKEGKKKRSRGRRSPEDSLRKMGKGEAEGSSWQLQKKGANRYQDEWGGEGESGES